MIYIEELCQDKEEEEKEEAEHPLVQGLEVEVAAEAEHPLVQGLEVAAEEQGLEANHPLLFLLVQQKNKEHVLWEGLCKHRY